MNIINIILDLDSQCCLPLEEALEMVQTLEPENLVWASEGVGYIYAERVLKQKELPGGLLQNKNLPPWSLGSLHSGMGMLFASWFLQNFKHQNSSSNSSWTLDHYLNLARENSTPGYGET